MSAYMCNATYTFDVNSQTDTVKMEYTVYQPGIGWKRHIDYVNTYPEAEWTELNFTATSSVKYIDFLNTMVYKNLEVARKIAKLSVDNVATSDPRKLIRIMNAIKVLDPTFTPPIINTDCTWQTELLEHRAMSTSYRIIATCKNKKRLQRYFRVLQLV
jgi:hypothetical protein